MRAGGEEMTAPPSQIPPPVSADRARVLFREADVLPAGGNEYAEGGVVMIDANAPAFPLIGLRYTNGQSVHQVHSSGLTIRAEIASRIMAAVCSQEWGFALPVKQLAEQALAATDTLIAELNKEPPNEKP